MSEAVKAVEKIAGHFILTTGWHRTRWSFLAGLVSAFAMPPFYAVPVLFVTFPLFIWLMDSAASEPGHGLMARARPAFATGWWFGFGYFLSGLWWIGNAFLADAREFLWLLPVAVVALPALLAIFWGLAAAFARMFWREDWRRLLALSASLGLAEYLRGTILTGFPWNLPGYAATPLPIAMQSASVVGMYAITVLTIFVVSLPALVRPGSGLKGLGKKFAIFLGICLVAAHLGYGYYRLSTASTEFVEGVKMRLVQPSIPQDEKMQAVKEQEIFDRLLQLSAGEGGFRKGIPTPVDPLDPAAPTPLEPQADAGAQVTEGDKAQGKDKADKPGIVPALSDDITYVIWPESALPFFLTERPDALTAIGELLPDKTKLITGAVRYEPPVPGKPDGFVFNSVYLVNSVGEIVAATDKVHLVPFGEYLPFQQLMESYGLEQLARQRGGFAAGSTVHTLNPGAGGAFLAQICYEIIFPGLPLYSGDRPSWILNLTNDAWFGRTPGPYQHWLQAILRGVEDGLPVIRVANSGISSVTDAYGRVLARTRLNEVVAIDLGLPKPVAKTLYMRHGNLPFFLLCFVFISLCILKSMPTKRERQD